MRVYKMLGRVILVSLVGSSFVGLRPLAAQSCFSAHRLPRCRSYWITEAGLSTRLNPEPMFSAVLLTLDAGYMVNYNARSALGATMFLQSSGMGLRPRYRRWLGDRMSVDVAPGIVLKAMGDQIARRAPAFSGQLGFNVGPALGVVGQVDVTRAADPIRFDAPATDVGWYVGGRLNNGFGLAGMLGCVALGVVVVATWDE